MERENKKSIGKYIQEIYEKVDNLKERLEKQNSKNNKHIFAFRGEPIDYKDTALMPSIFRNGNRKYESLSYDLAIDYRLNNANDQYVDQATNLQHYIALSRMLDITFNCLVALYFACCNYEKDSDEDGIIYIFDFPEYYSPHSKYIQTLYVDVLESNNSIAYSKNFRVFAESYTNPRIKSQSGGFIFFPGDIFSPINNIYYDKVEISGDDKKQIIKDLDTLFSINVSTLFPEKNEITDKMKKRLLDERNYSKPMKLTKENEIRKRIKDLFYELYVKKQNNEEELKDKSEDIKKRKKITQRKLYLRILRKEKKDLLISHKEHINCREDDDKIIEEINDNFRFMNAYFGGN